MKAWTVIQEAAALDHGGPIYRFRWAWSARGRRLFTPAFNRAEAYVWEAMFALPVGEASPSVLFDIAMSMALTDDPPARWETTDRHAKIRAALLASPGGLATAWSPRQARPTAARASARSAGRGRLTAEEREAREDRADVAAARRVLAGMKRRGEKPIPLAKAFGGPR